MTATYENIATTTLGSAQGDVTFSNISGSFTDLVLVCQGKVTSTTTLWIRINGDTGNNYSITNLLGATTAGASSLRESNTNRISTGYWGTTSGNTLIFRANFQNYPNTTTNKTVLVRQDNPVGNSGSTDTCAIVGLWRNTAAITSVTVLPQTGNLDSGSVLTLYGIKAE